MCWAVGASGLVYHRKGGLEDDEMQRYNNRPVHHRIGGLEANDTTSQKDALVNHRIGGLEDILFRQIT